jgi:acetylornithine aminotransferase
VTEVRGKGMMWGLVTTVPAGDVVAAAQKRGLLILVAGPDVVRLLPPLTLTADETNLLLQTLAEAVAEVEQNQAEA